jgi:hypothetical protein
MISSHSDKENPTVVNFSLSTEESDVLLHTGVSIDVSIDPSWSSIEEVIRHVYGYFEEMATSPIQSLSKYALIVRVDQTTRKPSIASSPSALLSQGKYMLMSKEQFTRGHRATETTLSLTGKRKLGETDIECTSTPSEEQEVKIPQRHRRQRFISEKSLSELRLSKDPAHQVIPYKSQERTNCAFCSDREFREKKYRRRTRFRCNICCVPLCMKAIDGSDLTCFQKWHTREHMSDTHQCEQV